MSLLDKASLICTPNAVKAGKLYSIVPSSGAGDMDVVRATTATRVNSLGLIENVALNVARLNYDTIGGCPSILVEPQRTNLILNSATVATQTITTTAVATTVSFYGIGTITFSGTYIGSLVGTGVNNRVNLTFTPTAGSLILTVVGSCVNGQLEAGSFATSYIPTVASIQTRNADVISKTGISSLIGQTEGTLFVEVKALLNGGSYRALSLSDNSNSNYVNIEYNLTSSAIFAGFQIGATSYFQANNSINQTDKNKLLITWQNGMFKFFTNGIKIFERNTFPNITTQLFNTLKFSRGDGQRSFDSMVSSLQLYKKALTDQECINLTTL
jgi:hypothetical protein